MAKAMMTEVEVFSRGMTLEEISELRLTQICEDQPR